jgi:N-acetylmuramoyl-L-alanine amidase
MRAIDSFRRRVDSPSKRLLLLWPRAQNISDILFAVRNSSLLIVFAFLGGCALAALSTAQAPPQPPPSQQQAPPPSNQPALPPPSPAPPQPPPGPVIVLDPAHGGTDNGARGQNGVFEKDIVLSMARTVRAELQSHGYRVVLTRDDDSNPSYDDRAAVANTFREAIFITLHVASTGTPGTARTYYDQFWTPLPVPASSDPDTKKPNFPVNTLNPWNQAQRNSLDASHRLADLLQLQLVQVFSGSPVTPSAAPIRELRSVVGPAVAIELSSVAVSNPESLGAEANPLALAMLRTLTAFHPVPLGGGN